jgi:hypothetical protein
MPRPYIAEIVIGPGVEYKITHRAGGGCTADEVREAFVLRSDVEMYGRDDGSVLGTGKTYGGRELFAVLHPLSALDGTWALKSAWPL